MNVLNAFRRWSATIDKRAALTLIALILLAVVASVGWASVKPIARAILQSDKTKVFACGYCSITVLLHYIFANDKALPHRIGECVLGACGYSMASLSSINLIGAAYLQFFYDGHAFESMGVLDVGSIILSASVLLIYCAVICTRMMLGVLFLRQGAEVGPSPGGTP